MTKHMFTWEKRIWENNNVAISMRFSVKIKKFGKDLGFIFPKNVIKKLKLKDGDILSIDINKLEN